MSRKSGIVRKSNGEKRQTSLEKAETSNFNSLNEYCLMNIFKYLPIKDRLGAEQGISLNF